jgi:hypothetical protein
MAVQNNGSRRAVSLGALVFLALMVSILVGWGRSDKFIHSLGVRWLGHGVDGKIDFYGQVVDQYESPVGGVDILVHLRKFRFSRPGTPWRVIEFHLKTDAQGYFKIEGESGMGVSFYGFKKKGYQYLLIGEISFNYQQNTNGIFKPDPSHPVVYKMRKKGEEAYLIRSENVPCFDFNVKESGAQKAYDFIMEHPIKGVDFEHPMLNGNPLTCDIKTKADYDPRTKRWKMLIWPGDPQGGILVSRNKYFVAPADGYLPSYTIEPDVFVREYDLAANFNPKATPHGYAYVYVRSRTPPVYTRFTITSIRIDEHSLEVGAVGCFTNPYGDRILEPAIDLPWEVANRLREEVRDSYINGRRPAKPELQKLIQEVMEKK